MRLLAIKYWKIISFVLIIATSFFFALYSHAYTGMLYGQTDSYQEEMEVVYYQNGWGYAWGWYTNNLVLQPNTDYWVMYKADYCDNLDIVTWDSVNSVYNVINSTLKVYGDGHSGDNGFCVRHIKFSGNPIPTNGRLGVEITNNSHNWYYLDAEIPQGSYIPPNEGWQAIDNYGDNNNTYKLWGGIFTTNPAGPLNTATLGTPQEGTQGVYEMSNSTWYFPITYETDSAKSVNGEYTYNLYYELYGNFTTSTNLNTYFGMKSSVWKTSNNNETKTLLGSGALQNGWYQMKNVSLYYTDTNGNYQKINLNDSSVFQIGGSIYTAPPSSYQLPTIPTSTNLLGDCTEYQIGQPNAYMATSSIFGYGEITYPTEHFIPGVLCFTGKWAYNFFLVPSQEAQDYWASTMDNLMRQFPFSLVNNYGDTVRDANVATTTSEVDFTMSGTASGMSGGVNFPVIKADTLSHAFGTETANNILMIEKYTIWITTEFIIMSFFVL